MKDQHTRPASPVDRPMYWEPSVAFLRWAIMLILGGLNSMAIIVYPLIIMMAGCWARPLPSHSPC